MLRSSSNRYSVLGEEDSDPTEVRLEMEDLQAPNKDTEQDRMSEVRGVLAGNSITYLTPSTFDLQRDGGPIAEEIQTSSEVREMSEAAAIEDNPGASSTKGLELPPDTVTNLFRRELDVVDMLSTCRRETVHPTKAR